MIRHIFDQNILFIVSTLILSSCERRPLEEDMSNRAYVPITVYWNEIDFVPQNVTALIYKEDGSLYMEHVFENSGQSATTKVPLEAGRYIVVIFNEKRDQIDYVRIRGYNNFSTLEAYATATSSAYETQSKSDGDVFINQPGGLATATKTIVVTEDMVSASNQFSGSSNTVTAGALNNQIELYPLLKTTEVRIKIHVVGLNNGRMPALADLRNMSGSYFFATDRNALEPVTTQFTIANRVFKDGSLTEGVVSTSVTSFGLLGDRKIIEDPNNKLIYLDVLFQLVDKERTVMRFSSDVTGAMRITATDKKAIKIDIDINQGVLPDVKPDGSSDSGMVTELIDWDYIKIPIEL